MLFGQTAPNINLNEGMKVKRPITGGIFYCRVGAGLSVSASNKLPCKLAGQRFEIGNKNIPPNRYTKYFDLKLCPGK